MDSLSVTSQLSDLLSNKRVVAGVFTTYNFEPDFFELDVIPELLNKGIPYSTDERVKTFQVREALRESGLIFDVFFDLQIFRKDAYISPQMEYLCHGVNQGQFAFHPKNVYLLVQDSDNEDTDSPMSLLVAAGSNNITRAGWWTNIESLHWEKIRNKQVSQTFLSGIKADIQWLKKHKVVDRASSLELIENFLKKCSYSNGVNTVNYFGLDESDFYRFLRQAKGNPLGQYQNWKLEIISPYFANNPDNELHTYFFRKLGVKNITMLLPLDEDGVPLCTQEYFDNIKLSENIDWGRFASDMHKTLGFDGEVPRRLHAKIYHFYNGVQSWAFVGSVNFSENAINYQKSKPDNEFVRNIESGYLVKLASIKPLLMKLSDDESFDKFNPPVNDESEKSDCEYDLTLPEVNISYDWKDKELTGHTLPRKKYEIQILSAEGISVIEPWEVKYSSSRYLKEIEELENILNQGSLVTIIGHELPNKTNGEQPKRVKFSQHRIMIQQTGWTHKKIDLPQLTAEQILAIYAGMTPEQRQMTILNAQLKHLIHLNLSGEITGLEDERTIKQFFCEYAEIFHAFGLLKKKLALALELKDFAQVDYYLSGTGMDSLPTLIELACDEESDSFSGVTTYLLILSAIEILKDSEFISRPLVKDFLAENRQRLNALKDSKLIQLDDNSSEQRDRFFLWFEEQFRREYSNLSLSEDNQNAGQQGEGKE